MIIEQPRDTILILTPVKDAKLHLERYFALLSRLTYSRHLISIALLESDSQDGTYSALQARLPGLQATYSFAQLFRKHFGFRLPPGVPRWAQEIQIQRRAILARSRNQLMIRALSDQDWVLWLDVDVIDYQPDVVERLLATRKEIVQPHCVLTYGGKTYDRNGWWDRGRVHLNDLRGEGDLVKLHAVGGTMLLIKADIHRDGLVFPPFLYGKENPLIRENNGLVRSRDKHLLLEGASRGEIETEGLGIMAHDMGYECWGMPNLEIRHFNG